MRAVIALLMVAAGIGLALVSFFFLVAPLGPPTSPIYSNPRVVGGPIVFLAGVILFFLAAVVYELLPERSSS